MVQSTFKTRLSLTGSQLSLPRNSLLRHYHLLITYLVLESAAAAMQCNERKEEAISGLIHWPNWIAVALQRHISKLYEMGSCHPHLSRGSCDFEQNYTKLQTPFIGTVLPALLHKVLLMVG